VAPLLLIALAAGKVIEVPAGGSLSEAMTAAVAGDTIRLPAGVFSAALRPQHDLTMEGAGHEETVIVAPEGEPAMVVTKGLTLTGVTLRAGGPQPALKVLDGGMVTAREVAFQGGAIGAAVLGGTLTGQDLDFHGKLYGLFVDNGMTTVERGAARADKAGIAVLRGRVVLSRYAVSGPASEAAISVSRGEVELDAVAIVSPGPTGISVMGNGRVTGRDVTVSGATSKGGFLGDCVQGLRSTVVLTQSELRGCDGAAVEASGGEIRLTGVDAVGGEVGCIALVDQARGRFEGVRCAGKGPGLVAASGSTAELSMNRWLGPPPFFVECEAGARLSLGEGETHSNPCR
jgi:hypothetical protein